MPLFEFLHKLMAVAKRARHGGCAGLLCMASVFASVSALAQSVELSAFALTRADGVLTLDFAANVTLPRPVEDALQRGVPVYFVAEANLFRGRWYWRDERIAHVVRTWRLAYQPLTNSWRVGFGGLNQTYPSLSEALSVVSRAVRWRLADLAQIDPDKNHYLEFSYRLDTTQLPSPMQIGLGGPSGWSVGVDKVQRLE